MNPIKTSICKKKKGHCPILSISLCTFRRPSSVICSNSSIRLWLNARPLFSCEKKKKVSSHGVVTIVGVQVLISSNVIKTIEIKMLDFYQLYVNRLGLAVLYRLLECKFPRPLLHSIVCSSACILTCVLCIKTGDPSAIGSDIQPAPQQNSLPQHPLLHSPTFILFHHHPP